MVLPNILNSISIVTLGIGGMEFICAQTPYSVKGLMVGTVYGSVVITAFIGYGITEPFTRHMITWSTGVISCGFWYLLLVIIVLIFNSTLLLILGKLYKIEREKTYCQMNRSLLRDTIQILTHSWSLKRT